MNIENLVMELPTGVFTMDSRFRITLWNKSMESISGYRAEEMVGKSWQQLHFHNPGVRDRRLSLADCLKSPTKVGEIQTEEGRVQKTAEIRCQAGNYRLVFLSVRVLPRTGEVLATVSDLSRTISCDQVMANELEVRGPVGAYGMVGKSDVMLSVFRQIELSAETEVHVFITGPSGTGKERVAEAIHRLSPRKAGPFLKVNCAALNENLLESELFGHAKGSFTGAVTDKKGYFEAASGGTLFLDEIGDITPMLQVKLLRVLQERVVTRVGEHRERPVDFRLVAATHRNLRARVQEGLFREDLYYRLHVMPIQIPALSERAGDLPLLLTHFVRKLNVKMGKSITGFTEEARRRLLEHRWPGNIRELENAMEHAFVVCDRDVVDVKDLPPDIRGDRNGPIHQKRGENETVRPAAGYRVRTRKAWPDRENLEQILAKHDGNRTRTAAELGVSTVALWKHMKTWA